MKIDKLIETNEGTVQFNGELTGEELGLIIEAGLRTLLLMGVIQTTASQIKQAEAEKPHIVN